MMEFSRTPTKPPHNVSPTGGRKAEDGRRVELARALPCPSYVDRVIPQEFLTLYLGANAFALAVLALTFWSRDAARWVGAAVFAWAAVVNSWTALVQPQVYLEYADLALSAIYRGFILGWFSRHIQAFVLLIAAGQLAIAALLASPRVSHRRLGAGGAVAFLLAISPLGVGSGFPFSLTFGAALLLSVRPRYGGFGPPGR